VTKEIKKGYSVESTRLYLSGRSISVVCNYFADDFSGYNYPWRWCTPALERKFKKTGEAVRKKHLRLLRKVKTI
jgi:hypothetical protein